MAVSRFLHRRRVSFHETDLAGIAHFSNFLKYMEETEHAFLRSLGFAIYPESERGRPLHEGWPRLKAACDYHAPLFCDEEIEIELFVGEVREKSIRYRFVIWKDPDGARVKSATGEIVAVHVRADRAAGSWVSAPMPVRLRESIEPHPAARGAAENGQ